MQLTRRAWTVAGSAGVLGAYAVVVDSYLPLLGLVLLGAWWLDAQARFVGDIAALADQIEVTQAVEEPNLRPQGSTDVTLDVERSTSEHLEGTATAGLPPATRGEDIVVELPPARERAATTASVTWPVAGEHTFDPAALDWDDGLFTETIEAGDTPSVTVDPHGMSGIHVGEGGDQVAGPYGEHRSGQTGAGMEPSGVREYQPGDQTSRIDWKATARFDDLFVRETEAETDRAVYLLFDHRHRLGEGPAGLSKLALLRAVALLTVNTARDFDDPIGLVGVGNAGITTARQPNNTAAAYLAVRETLLSLDATDPDAGHASPTAYREPIGGVDAQRRLAELGESSRFAETLRPLLAHRESYLERFQDRPLFGGMRRIVAESGADAQVCLFTDDAARAEVQETVRLARRNGLDVLVCLAPDVLFRSQALADAEETYRDYVAFEEFRRVLSRMGGVRAYEVGPADRLSIVLEQAPRRTEAVA